VYQVGINKGSIAAVWYVQFMECTSNVLSFVECSVL